MEVLFSLVYHEAVTFTKTKIKKHKSKTNKQTYKQTNKQTNKQKSKNKNKNNKTICIGNFVSYLTLQK
jgi:hypothetical protein